MKEIYVVPHEFSEKVGLATLVELTGKFAKKDITSIEIDFSSTTWADPQPLLMLGCLIAENSSKCKININLGSTGNILHNVFLKYLSTQKILRSYSNFASACLFLVDKKNRNNDRLTHEWKEIIGKTENSPHSMHIISTLCIGTQIINIKDFSDNEEGIGNLVEEYVNEARTKILLLSSSASKSSKERLLQKIRKILHELLCNSAEHGYSDKKTGYSAIYARIRQARPKLEKEKEKWENLREKEALFSPTSDRFTFAPSLEWLELFVCDVGSGLLAHSDRWDLSNAKHKKLKQSKDPLKIISELIFRENVSRHSYKSRLDKSKSIITGLQHIGMMLSIDGDYSRMYTKGAWVGEMHPWDVGKTSGKGTTGKT